MVITRVITLLLIFSSMITLAMAIIMRPWKTETYNNDIMEISLWTICRADAVKYVLNCYNNYYKENDEGQGNKLFIYNGGVNKLFI